jgi:soluble lytic murein transglycosylase-like protein
MRISIERQRAAARGLAQTAQSPVTPSEAQPFFALSWPALGPSCDALADQELNGLIEQASQKEGVDGNLLRAVAAQESGFRPCAVSPKGAMGMMQLMPATARELGVRDPFDPGESLISGAHLLKQLLERFNGDTALALSAYNAGAHRVEESGGIPDIPETIHYVAQILNRLPLP